MIPSVAIMLGAYISTKMIHLMTRRDANQLVKLFAVLTIGVAIAVCTHVMMTDTSFAANFPVIGSASTSPPAVDPLAAQ